MTAAHQSLDAVEADHALARGRLVHARFLEDRVEDEQELELFERAARLYKALGDPRGEGEALFWVGIVHQVIRDDTPTAAPFFERSLALAEQADDALTKSYALRHLGFTAQFHDRLDEAREHLDESTRLRRELAFLPGVAANLIVLATLDVQQGRPQDAAARLAEATELAQESRAAAVVRWADAAREQLGLTG
ncbi:hypothetical protein GCM10009839_06920 [Catenulispora yoronensis]|uniref:Tetratricopeptide repeat protein n=1 Tax=Catenulispora yoronensis TaxID=450799 RepID=A0ABN2TP65_9ACTN